MTLKVAITQPYVPAYRFPLWDAVVGRLRDEGIESRIFFGGDQEQMALRAARGDAVDAPWAERVPTRTVQMTRRLPKLMHRKLPKEWTRALLLTEMQATNGNAWSALARRRPYITFGHGTEYTSNAGGVSVRLESALNRGAEHVLTYLPSGRDVVIGRTGLPTSRVTSFNNSTDTHSLRDAMETCSSNDVEGFRRRFGLPDGATVALVLGALNHHKRVDIMFDAAQKVLSARKDMWIVVAGDGPERQRIEQLARSTERVVLLGQASPAEYAPAATLASYIINPGRVGLVAVDALAMHLPILTSEYAMHAPEAEYLTEGVSVFTAAASVDEFARMWMDFDTNLVPRAWDSVPTIESAATSIADAVVEAARRGGLR